MMSTIHISSSDSKLDNCVNLSDQETQEKSSENSVTLSKFENLKLLDEIDTIMMNEKFLDLKLKNWNYSSLKDEYRPDYANKSSGGIDFQNKKVTSLLRSTGYDILKQIGKKIISGDFNLTTISFPIKIMLPLTILQTVARSVFQFPIYLNLAGLQIDPLEKFKFAIVATISCYHSSSYFMKPMNPILGETYEMMWEDGSKVYLEQTSHHPPVTHFYMIGPNNQYKFYGFSNFTSSAGLNSLKLTNKGKRCIEFRDGTRITASQCNETFSNTFMGTVRQESVGELHFKDHTNGFECVLKFNSVKKKPSDYFSGEVKLKNIPVCKVYGSYLSYIEFNNFRYWDIRENIGIKHIEVDKQIKSSSLFREDRVLLEKGDIEAAQSAKERLEELQRNDRKLREKYQKSLSHK